MILSSASRRSQHYSPAGSAKGRDSGSPRLRSQPTAQGTGTTPSSHELPGEQDPTPHPSWKQSRVYGLGASAPLPALPALSCCHTFHLVPCREFNSWESTAGLPACHVRARARWDALLAHGHGANASTVPTSRAAFTSHPPHEPLPRERLCSRPPAKPNWLAAPAQYKPFQHRHPLCSSPGGSSSPPILSLPLPWARL